MSEIGRRPISSATRWVAPRRLSRPVARSLIRSGAVTSSTEISISASMRIQADVIGELGPIALLGLDDLHRAAARARRRLRVRSADEIPDLVASTRNQDLLLYPHG